MEWAWNGTTYEWSADWWQAWAAMLQAGLTAAAVFAAVWLQNRALDQRDKEVRNRRVEGLALLARYAYDTVERAAGDFTEGMHPDAVLRSFELGHLTPPLEAIKRVDILQLDDVALIQAFLDLDRAYTAAEGRLRVLIQQAHDARGSDRPINASSFMGDRTTALHNAAASIERRVAKLVGRQPGYS